MSERCKRICGRHDEDCFVRNQNQLACIADMVINKVSGILGITELAKEENLNERTSQFLDLALKDIRELINWVKFLQITHDLRIPSSIIYEVEPSEKRKEPRFPLPELYCRYLVMQINISGSFETVSLLNFSQFGMQFRCPRPIEVDSVKEGILRSAGADAKEISFKVEIRHCTKQQEEYVIGCKIETVSGSSVFDFFKNVHDIILNAITGT